MARPNPAAQPYSAGESARATVGLASRVGRHRTLPQGKTLVGKIPRDFGEDEANVVWGIGSDTAGGAGVKTFSIAAARSCIVRRLYIAAGNVRGRVTALQISADNLLFGPSCPIEAFAPTTVDSPEFDYWCNSQAPLTLTLQLDAAYTVDVAFAID